MPAASRAMTESSAVDDDVDVDDVDEGDDADDGDDNADDAVNRTFTGDSCAATPLPLAPRSSAVVGAYPGLATSTRSKPAGTVSENSAASKRSGAEVETEVETEGGGGEGGDGGEEAETEALVVDTCVVSATEKGGLFVVFF